MLKVLIDHHDSFESVGAIATAIALVVPVPAYFVVKFLEARGRRRESAQDYLTTMMGEYHLIAAGRHALEKLPVITGDWRDKFTENQQNSVMKMFSDYELLCWKVNSGRIDKNTIRSWVGIELWQDWTLARPLVEQIRRERGRPIYWHWENLAEQWSPNAKNKSLLRGR